MSITYNRWDQRSVKSWLHSFLLTDFPFLIFTVQKRWVTCPKEKNPLTCVIVYVDVCKGILLLFLRLERLRHICQVCCLPPQFASAHTTTDHHSLTCNSHLNAVHYSDLIKQLECSPCNVLPTSHLIVLLTFDHFREKHLTVNSMMALFQMLFHTPSSTYSCRLIFFISCNWVNCVLSYLVIGDKLDFTAVDSNLHVWDQVKVWILKGEKPHSKCISRLFSLLFERYLNREIQL